MKKHGAGLQQEEENKERREETLAPLKSQHGLGQRKEKKKKKVKLTFLIGPPSPKAQVRPKLNY